MSAKQPTFKERIRLLDIAAHEIQAHAESLADNELLRSRLRSTAAIIADEAARMKLSNQRWEQQRQTKKAPVAPTLDRASDETDPVRQ